MRAALAGGSLPPKLREEIALAVGELNGCQYCVSAHTAIGKLTGLTDDEIEDAREGRSHSPKVAAALEFTRLLVANRGRVTDANFEAVRKAGLGDGEIAEIITQTALNIFMNYFNTATEVELILRRSHCGRLRSGWSGRPVV
jgi:AhpD family alkylhydroperoxidase